MLYRNHYLPLVVFALCILVGCRWGEPPKPKLAGTEKVLRRPVPVSSVVLQPEIQSLRELKPGESIVLFDSTTWRNFCAVERETEYHFCFLDQKWGEQFRRAGITPLILPRLNPPLLIWARPMSTVERRDYDERFSPRYDREAPPQVVFLVESFSLQR